jgi:hypothetical protein
MAKQIEFETTVYQLYVVSEEEGTRVPVTFAVCLSVVF